MSLLSVLLCVVPAALIGWWGRRMARGSVRGRVALAARLLAVAALAASLLGGSHRRLDEVPRRLVYLVDGSDSLDGAQREWITRRIASLEQQRPKPVRRAVVVFGAGTRVVMPMGQEPLADPRHLQQLLERAEVPRGETNLETALLALPGLLAPERGAGVILLTDGQETAGNVTGALAAVKRLGLEVFPAPPPVFGRARTVWEELAVPPTVPRGSPVAVQLVVFSSGSAAKTGQVAVALQGVAVKRQRVTVRPGWQVLTVTVPAIGQGTMELDVRLTVPDEGIDEQRRAYTEVEGAPRVLMVTEPSTALPALVTALKRRELDVAVSRLTDLPAEPGRLMDYDAVVLFHLPKSLLAEGQIEALRRYVEESGGGLVAIGLGGDLAHEIQTPSPLDALLPIQFEAKGLQEAKRRICMVLLIDRSASMLGPRLAATKKAAIELVKQLAPEDLVGILAFDTKPYVVAEVQQAGQLGPSLIEKLVQLRASGGTDIYPALAAADNRLELTGAALKHIILLSDGNTPFHAEAYRALANSFTLSGTTVSTIGVGSAFINTDFLEWLARSTGGTYYQLQSLDQLPKLVANDARDQIGRLPFAEGLFRPARTPMTDWFAEIPEWPSLRGYLTATAKPSARVDLTINGGAGDDPLLARWTLGRGRVVAFTSDADARWSPAWIRWNAFEAVWAQVVRWAMRPRLGEELFVWVDTQRGAPQLVVEGSLHDPRGALIPDGTAEPIPLSFVQTGAWRWDASLAQVPSGWYQLALESRTAEGPVFAKRWVQIGTLPATREASGQPPREGLLRELARATSGAYDAPDRALLPPTTTSTVTEPLFTWWLPLVIVALLIDIWARGSTML
ncbi:MAG: VWA domain-containing protein [Candidatus Omnitrophica bacterium]|nr:VWA domain-containing protein [Candidatus Omnitrophota bacterium]